MLNKEEKNLFFLFLFIHIWSDCVVISMYLFSATPLKSLL